MGLARVSLRRMDNPLLLNPRMIAAAIVVTATGGCTTTQEVRRPDGAIEFQIACGAALGWNICYDKANELCPTGYTTVMERAGFNRKELRIACPGATKQVP
jgi:hypothetical protein